jgi:hypothetical protein
MVSYDAISRADLQIRLVGLCRLFNLAARVALQELEILKVNVRKVAFDGGGDAATAHVPLLV